MEIRFRLTANLNSRRGPTRKFGSGGIGAKGIRDWMMIREEGHRALERKKALFLLGDRRGLNDLLGRKKQGQAVQSSKSRKKALATVAQAFSRARVFQTSHPCETETTTTLGPGDFPAKSGFVIAARQTDRTTE